MKARVLQGTEAAPLVQGVVHKLREAIRTAFRRVEQVRAPLLIPDGRSVEDVMEESRAQMREARRAVQDLSNFLKELAESKEPNYNDDTMGDATARLEAVAADFSLPVDVAKHVLTAAASELTARETTARATEPPRQDRSPELVAAMLKDSILGRLQEKFEKQLREIELPEGGFTTIEQARAGKSFAKTFHDLQERRRKLGLPPIEKPDRVTEAASMASDYYRHHTETGEYIPPRPRGRPRKAVQSEAAPSS